MQKCLKTYSAGWNMYSIKKYRLTKEDMCEAGYSLSGYLILLQDISRQVVADEKKFNQNFYKDEKSLVEKEILKEKISEEIDSRLQSKIRMEQKSNLLW